MPYTYRLSWKEMNKHYYGVRYSSDCNPKELFVTYFTSSKYVKEFVELYGYPDVIKTKTFDNVNDARVWETKFLKKVNAVLSRHWLNKTDNISIHPDAAKHGWSTESRIKASISHTGKVGPNKGRVFSEETKNKMRLAHLGKKHSVETKILMSQKQKNVGGYGPKFHSEETKTKMSISHRSKNK
jgi:hypothetical protein